MPDPSALLTALHAGPATLDALAARLGGPARDALTWALEDARERGWVVSLDGDCGPDGICSTGAPAIFLLSEAGRARAGELRRADDGDRSLRAR